jgi:iron complex transport system substrate-binding protein
VEDFRDTPTGQPAPFRTSVFYGPAFGYPLKLDTGEKVCCRFLLVFARLKRLSGWLANVVTTMDPAQRIVSFLPSATEMICALGLGHRLMGITHECDHPQEIEGKPVVVRSVLPTDSMNPQAIDVAVTERLREGLSLYRVDEVLLREIAPDLIVTQDLCQVCAPSGNEVAQVLASLPSKPRILWLTPKSLDQIFENLRELGEATGQLRKAEEIIVERRERIAKIAVQSSRLSPRPRVFCMEWIDPVYCSGHWVPEMIRIAGGTDELGRNGADSVRISWNDVLQWAPEVLILMPCGCGTAKATEQALQLSGFPGWSELPAVRDRRVYAVDASSYFARPGPRLVEGTELLAHLLHPASFWWEGPPDAFRTIEQ